jgi:hypothetical protein
MCTALEHAIDAHSTYSVGHQVLFEAENMHLFLHGVSVPNPFPQIVDAIKILQVFNGLSSTRCVGLIPAGQGSVATGRRISGG